MKFEKIIIYPNRKAIIFSRINKAFGVRNEEFWFVSEVKNKVVIAKDFMTYYLLENGKRIDKNWLK